MVASLKDVILKYFSCFKVDFCFNFFLSLQILYIKELSTSSCSMRRFHFNILYQQLPESFEILVIFQPEASFMKSEFFFELLEYFDTERDTIRCSHQTGIFSIFMEVFKIPPHPDSNFCEELYAKTQCWYILVLGGAKLKFALLTPQSIPKAHSIKYFSLLKKK